MPTARAVALLAPILFQLGTGDPGRAEIYACAGDAIRVFADDADSNEAPIRILQSTGLTECYGIALDNLHDEVWVGDGLSSTFSVYRASADGTVEPLRTIGGGASELGIVVGVAVDVEADEVYATNANGEIFVFPRLADGDASPIRKIFGISTELGGTLTPFVDRVNDELYVAAYNQGELVVFGRTDSGDVEPARAPIGGAGASPFGLFVDPRAGEIFVGAGDAVVRVFNLAGNALRSVAGAQTQIEKAYGLTVTSEGRLLVGSQEPTASDPDPILGFARSLNGDAVPVPHLLLGAPANRGIWGVVSSRALGCAEGNVASLCLFRDGFERGDAGNWKPVEGEAP